MAPKKKVEKMSLGDFLGDQSLGSWADEMEDHMPVSDSRGFAGGERRAFSSAAGFGDRSDRFAERGFARQQLPLPSKPPYTAHLGNLPFDATEGDVEDFFAGCDVSSIRIVEDKIEHKPKGFGYVEYKTVEGLKKALELDGRQFNGRNIRISVAEPPKERQDTRTVDDWTRKGPLPDLPQHQQRRASDRGSVDMERGGSRRGHGAGFNEGDGKARDFNNWERRGPLSPVPAQDQPMRGPARVRTNDGPRERKLSPSWGDGRTESRDGSRPPRGEIRDRPQVDRQPTPAELDNQWRSRMRPDPPAKSNSPTPEPSAPSSPAQPPPPTVRPRLNLQKRTVSEAEPAAAAGSGDSSKPNPFGGARPIDTAAREREIEEKRQLALRLKKDQEDKAREDKKVKEAAARAAAPDEASSPTVESASVDDDAKENVGEEPKSASYQVLSEVDDEGKAVEDNEEQDAPANGDIVEDKAVKPREFIREPPKGPKGQDRSWRRKSSTQAAPASPAGATAENLEEEGWSTVPSSNKRGRGRGNAGRQAVAS